MSCNRWLDSLTGTWDLLDEWYRAVKFGIRNLIQWFPVVWADRHYTSAALFDVMRHKLVLMQRELRHNPYYVGAERDLHLMHVCELLIKRYLAEDYATPCLERHRKKWGRMRHFMEPAYHNDTGEHDPNLYIWFSEWTNAFSRQEQKTADDEL